MYARLNLRVLCGVCVVGGEEYTVAESTRRKRTERGVCYFNCVCGV